MNNDKNDNINNNMNDTVDNSDNETNVIDVIVHTTVHLHQLQVTEISNSLT